MDFDFSSSKENSLIKIASALRKQNANQSYDLHESEYDPQSHQRQSYTNGPRSVNNSLIRSQKNNEEMAFTQELSDSKEKPQRIMLVDQSRIIGYSNEEDQPLEEADDDPFALKF